nr:VCBS repeat-containing protein [Candidatus Sigynarchaeota archaeon]
MLFVLACTAMSLAVHQSRLPTSARDDARIRDSSAGRYYANGEVLFWQGIGDGVPTCIQGINSQNGQTATTDILMMGNSGFGSMRGVMGYNASIFPQWGMIQSDDDDLVVDMVKFEDPNDHNMDIIYAERNEDAGEYSRFVRLRGVNPSYTGDGVEIYPENTWTLTGQNEDAPESMCVGNFDNDAAPEMAAVASGGHVYNIANVGISSFGIWHDYDYPWTVSSWWENLRYRKDLITPIDALTSQHVWQDIIVGHIKNVTALSTNTSNQVIWEREFSNSYIESVVVFPDITGDGKQEVIAATSNALYLLNGATGAIIASFTGLGNHFRMAAPINDINGDGVPDIITGNSQGRILILDANSTSPTFQKVINGTSFRNAQQIWSILNIGDVDGDTKPDFAIGGSGMVGVLYGNNATWRWVLGVNEGYWNGANSLNVYDITLLDDRDNDGVNDFAVASGVDGYGGIFIYSSKGSGQYYDENIHGWGSINLNCTADVNYTFQFQLDVTQDENLSCTANITIDGTAHPMTQSTVSWWSTGNEFVYSTSLLAGIHNYSFNVADVNLVTWSSGLRNGPQVGGDCNPTTPPNPFLDPATITVIGIAGGGIAVVGIACGVIRARRH